MKTKYFLKTILVAAIVILLNSCAEEYKFQIDVLKPAEISGGKKKRVGLARAIAYRPKYVLYDEPTTGLDPIMSDVINDLILHLQKEIKVTSIVVTHDMKSAYKVSNRIAMLYQGVIQGIGTPDEIKNTKNPLIRQFIEGLSHGPINLDLDTK